MVTPRPVVPCGGARRMARLPLPQREPGPRGYGGENVNGDGDSYMTMAETGPLAGQIPRTPDGTFRAVRKTGDALSREELAGMLSDVLKILHSRATASRFKPKNSDPGLMAIVRGFVQGAQALTAVLRDSDLDDLGRRIAALEEATDDRTRKRGDKL